MPIKYNKLLQLLKDKGYSTYRIRQDGLLGQSTLQKIKSGKGNIDTRTIERLCTALDCQPGDIMEYVKDEE